jgi:hypothetical protein
MCPSLGASYFSQGGELPPPSADFSGIFAEPLLVLIPELGSQALTIKAAAHRMIAIEYFIIPSVIVS